MEYATADGPIPEEIIEINLMERFGWTIDELDEADAARLYPAVSAANIAAALSRVVRWMEMAGQGVKAGKPSDSDMRIWSEAHGMIRDA